MNFLKQMSREIAEFSFQTRDVLVQGSSAGLRTLTAMVTSSWGTRNQRSLHWVV